MYGHLFLLIANSFWYKIKSIIIPYECCFWNVEGILLDKKNKGGLILLNVVRDQRFKLDFLTTTSDDNYSLHTIWHHIFIQVNDRFTGRSIQETATLCMICDNGGTLRSRWLALRLWVLFEFFLMFWPEMNELFSCGKTQ